MSTLISSTLTTLGTFHYVLRCNLDSLQDKKKQKENEAVQNEMVGQAHVENYALKLFLYADNEDRGGRFGK